MFIHKDGIEEVFDESIKLADNAMLKHRKELFYEWDFEKNNELGLSVYNATYGSGKLAWWNCPDCGSEYDMEIYRRSSGRNCPYCKGRRVNQTNSLASLMPDIAREWHSTRNGDLTPHGVTSRNDRIVWWMGECGHEWDAPVYDRTMPNGTGCPICSNHRVLIGFNDMWTTNPEQAKLLDDPEDGHRYTQSSGQNVDWKCAECKTVIRDRRISSICRQGLSCPKCSDGVKFPEKFMYNLLRESNIDFEFDIERDWTQGKRYDFYLPKYNWIIEMHGGQHYGVGFSSFEGARILEEEQENDAFKENLAKRNGIANYIVIDARKSTVKWIKASILNSSLKDIIGNIDFEEIGQLASNSFIKEACDLWDSGFRSTSQIASIMKLEASAIRAYLKRGVEIGWSNYCPKKALRMSALMASKSRVKPVAQLERDLSLIKMWESATEAERYVGVNNSEIISTCRGKRKTAGGFRWMYREEYEKYLSGDIKVPPMIHKHAKGVVQLDGNLKLIKVFPSLSEASASVGLSSGTTISNVCKGRSKTAGGFKWMYKEDYDKNNIANI